jgi:hypothetical protein
MERQMGREERGRGREEGGKRVKRRRLTASPRLYRWLALMSSHQYKTVGTNTFCSLLGVYVKPAYQRQGTLPPLTPPSLTSLLAHPSFLTPPSCSSLLAGPSLLDPFPPPHPQAGHRISLLERVCREVNSIGATLLVETSVPDEKKFYVSHKFEHKYTWNKHTPAPSSSSFPRIFVLKWDADELV